MSIRLRKEDEVMDWGTSLAGIDVNEYSKDTPNAYVPPEPKEINPEEERKLVEIAKKEQIEHD